MIAGIVLLSGPPAAGKDTVTAALGALDSRFVLFDKIKIGRGRSTGYRMLREAQYADLLAAGEILQSHERYGNRYAVDKPHLRKLCAAGAIPVIHVGRRANLPALRVDPSEWSTFSVLLWVSRDVAAQRLQSRGSGDITERMAAYDEEWRDLQAPDAAGDYDLVICGDALPPSEAADRIVQGLEHAPDGEHVMKMLAKIARS